jgi:hypothetical protein
VHTHRDPAALRPLISRARLLAAAAAAATALLADPHLGSAATSDPFTGSLPAYDMAAPTGRDLSGGTGNASGLRGAASYSYPIAVPPGRLGVQPNVALSYSSAAPLYGNLAAGWSLGIPMIEVDTSAGTNVERYLVNGRRLIRAQLDTTLYYIDLGGGVFTTRAFRAELDASMTRYGFYDAGPGGRRVWVAKSPDGRTRYFEQTDGQRWALTRERDSFGNTITYRYTIGGTASSSSASTTAPTRRQASPTSPTLPSPTSPNAAAPTSCPSARASSTA